MSQTYLNDWSVVASVVGALAALWAIWYTARTHRLSVRERREAQAGLVSTWAESWSTSDVEAGNELQISAFNAVVYNASNQPVYEVHITLLRPNWRDDETPVVSRIIPVLTPNSESEHVRMPPSPGRKDHRFIAPALEIEFTDNRGRRWLRRPDGDLREVKTLSAFRRLGFLRRR